MAIPALARPAAVLALALFSAAPAAAASFACTGALKPDEAAVCAHRDLSNADVKMDTLYTTLARLVGMGQRGDLMDAQRAFLARRAACGDDLACLRSAYHGRIGELERALGALAARGPF